MWVHCETFGEFAGEHPQVPLLYLLDLCGLNGYVFCAWVQLHDTKVVSSWRDRKEPHYSLLLSVELP